MNIVKEVNSKLKYIAFHKNEKHGDYAGIVQPTFSTTENPNPGTWLAWLYSKDDRLIELGNYPDMESAVTLLESSIMLNKSYEWWNKHIDKFLKKQKASLKLK